MAGAAQTFGLGGRPVHRIGLGAMQLPGPGVFGPPRDRDAALTVLRRAVELGVDHIDTAQYYGPDVSNELIHEALHPYPTELVIVSKVGARRDERGGWHPAGTPQELRAGVQDNLRSLGLGRIDVVNLRRFEPGQDDPQGVSFDEQIDAMAALREEGLIGAIGLSNVGREELEIALTRTEIACVQNPLNMLNRASLDVLRACAAHEIAFVPFFPLGSAFGGQNQLLQASVVVQAADRLQATPAQVALAWLLAQGGHVLLIPGTSSVGHLQENLAAADLQLDEQTLAELDAAA